MGKKTTENKAAARPVKAPAGPRAGKTKRPADRTIKSFYKAISEGAVDKVKKAVNGSMPASIRFDPWGNGERTPLIHALWSNQPAVAAVLIDAGADILDAGDDGSTPLHHVEDDAICARLIAAGAEVNATTPRGQTALHRAASQNAVGIARQLIAAGADVNATDRDHLSALHHTTSIPIRDLLLENGATPLPSRGGVPLEMTSRTVSLSEVDAERGAIGIGGDGALWVGSYSGLYRYDGETVTHYDTRGDSGSTPAIDAIVAGPEGVTYFGTNCGLIRASDGAFTIYDNHNSPLHDPHLVYTAADAAGRVYCVGYESESESKHISVFDGEGWSVLRPDGVDLPREMELQCIRFTAAGEMLIGTDDGVYARTGGAWKLDELDENTFSPTIYDIAITGSTTWFGTQRGVYRRTASGELSLTKTEHLAQVLCVDGDVMWVGTGYGGIYKFDIASGELLGHLTDESTGCRLNNLERIVRGGDGSVWVQAFGSLYALRAGVLEPIASPRR